MQLSETERMNIYLILMGIALTFESNQAFDYAVKKLGASIGTHEKDYLVARKKVDKKMRSLLELVLHAAIFTCNIE